jgi:hypothetical protein
VLAPADSKARALEDYFFMLHITCDLCGKDLCPGQDDRFVVKIEVFASRDPSDLTEADLDDDNMEAVSDLLREMANDDDGGEALPPKSTHFRYDLCPSCHKKFVRDPLAKELAQKFDFSKN